MVRSVTKAMQRKTSSSPIAPWLSQDPDIWQPHPEMLALSRRKDVATYYVSDDRSMGVWIVREWESPRRHTQGFRFRYCPFSGRRLPGQLSSTMRRVLMKQFSRDDARDMLDHVRKRPLEFRSDRWWRERRISLRTGRYYHYHKIQKEIADRLAEGTPLTWMEEHNDRQAPGYRRSPCEPPHLCVPLSKILSQHGAMFWYMPQDREYGIRILNPRQKVHDQTIEVAAVPYCPWCGKKFPPTLKALRLQRLEALGLSPDDPALPEKWRTDQWWREEGLWPDAMPKDGAF